MELLSPAGSLEKLYYAYTYGADAAYIGLGAFSLRQKASNLFDTDPKILSDLKGDKKLYGAMNVFFHEGGIDALKDQTDRIAALPLDALIVSDLGAASLVKRALPDLPLHLSTQANATNAEAVRVYRDLGFSRIILGREVTLDEVKRIKDAVPEMELEVFAHGAMCLAYSGRCFLSAWMADRSGNDGLCAHSCRWEYRYLEERERPGELYPVIEGEDYTTILSSKDMCLIRDLRALKDAGIDSIKIEGRMKSVYYAAVVTRAYRKTLDALEGQRIDNLEAYQAEVHNVSHREFSKGFLLNKEEVIPPTEKTYERKYEFMGTLGEELAPGEFLLEPRNKLASGETLSFIGPDILEVTDDDYEILTMDGEPAAEAVHGRRYRLRPSAEVRPGYILRRAL